MNLLYQENNEQGGEVAFMNEGYTMNPYDNFRGYQRPRFKEK